MTIEASEINRWSSVEPLLGASLDEDADMLARYIEKGNTFLKQIPEKCYRNDQEKHFAEQIFASCRQIRNRFIDRHAKDVYKILTEDFSQHLRLSELVYSAAERFPGLVPTREQIDAEQKHIQAHKEGLEIDQGIFFRGLLRSPIVGSHLADAMLLPCSRALGLLKNLKQTDKIDLGTILLERRGHAAYLTINNQSSLNAEDNSLVYDMETAVDLTLLDERVKVGVLRGGVMSHPRYFGKRVFCAGINLSDLQAGKISFVDFLLARELGYISKIKHGLIGNPMTKNLSTRTIQKPWIAAVDSFAIGGGMQLLLVFDKVIAADDVYFSLPAAQEGIIPGAANFRLARIIGSRLTRQIILSGRKIFASEPAAQWLCDEVVPVEKIDESIETSVKQFSNTAVVENRRMLGIAEESRDGFREYMAEFAYVQSTRLYSEDVLAKIDRWGNSALKKYAKMQEEDQCL
jgi:(3,5-dihydroxyphenyl)acetyl-CoA 1,2-dioxygenase